MASDFDKLDRLQSLLDASGIPTAGVAIGPPVRVDYSPAATAQQRTQGETIRAAFNPNDAAAQQTFDVSNARKKAKAVLNNAASADNDSRLSVVIRAAVLALLDVVNQRTPAAGAAVTAAQLKNLISQKIDSGNAD